MSEVAVILVVMIMVVDEGVIACVIVVVILVVDITVVDEGVINCVSVEYTVTTTLLIPAMACQLKIGLV